MLTPAVMNVCFLIFALFVLFFLYGIMQMLTACANRLARLDDIAIHLGRIARHE
jgi:hypothetical protein